MSTFRESVPLLVSSLNRHFGRPRGPAETRSRFEKLVACYWERVVSTKQADAAVRAFEEAGLNDARSPAELDPVTLQDLLREAGLSVSAKVLAPFSRLVRALADHPDILLDPVDDAAAVPTRTLRDELVAIPGIGPATADDLLLRVFGQARYPLDRATYRILLRHGWIDSTADYEETNDLLVGSLGGEPNLLADVSLWFEELGRSHCRAGGPRCENCPLQPLLPEGGPLGDES